jgi:hypothetical protein
MSHAGHCDSCLRFADLTVGVISGEVVGECMHRGSWKRGMSAEPASTVAASFGADAFPRRSTSSLEAFLDTDSALVYRIQYEQSGGQRFS